MQPGLMGDRWEQLLRVSRGLTLHGQQWKCAFMPWLQVKGDAFDIIYFCTKHVAQLVSALSCSMYKLIASVCTVSSWGKDLQQLTS